MCTCSDCNLLFALIFRVCCYISIEKRKKSLLNFITATDRIIVCACVRVLEVMRVLHCGHYWYTIGLWPTPSVFLWDQQERRLNDAYLSLCLYLSLHLTLKPSESYVQPHTTNLHWALTNTHTHTHVDGLKHRPLGCVVTCVCDINFGGSTCLYTW